jgi:hypothetical protein
MKRICFIAIFSVFFLSGCLDPEGEIELKGKVLDDYTKVSIPNRKILVHALVYNDNSFTYNYAGEFCTDSSGQFRYKMKKVKYINTYDFNVVGDSVYAHTDQKLSLMDLKRERKNMTFFASKLIDFTIKINRNSKTPVPDTLYVSWKSNDIPYPFETENRTRMSQKWIQCKGNDVKSTIKTKVFADKKTIVFWKLYSNGKLREMTDTIFCKRDVVYSACFNY